MATYIVPIIGDGKYLETAFRPDLSGLDLIAYSVSIPMDGNGELTSDTCVVTTNDG